MAFCRGYGPNPTKWGIVCIDENISNAVIADVDGTLVDTVDQHAMAWREAFQRFGHEIPFAVMRQQIGKGEEQLLPVFL
jgi:phosphoglycolate phosphatase-like HAD superfamily hydrolase